MGSCCQSANHEEKVPLVETAGKKLGQTLINKGKQRADKASQILLDKVESTFDNKVDKIINEKILDRVNTKFHSAIDSFVDKTFDNALEEFVSSYVDHKELELQEIEPAQVIETEIAQIKSKSTKILKTWGIPCSLINIMEEEGWLNEQNWGALAKDELKRMDFKNGHIEMFMKGIKEMDEQKQENSNANLENNNEARNTKPSNLLRNWGIPTLLVDKIEAEGWIHPEYWDDITDIELEVMGFKRGHISTFKREFKKWKEEQDSQQTVSKIQLLRKLDNAQPKNRSLLKRTIDVHNKSSQIIKVSITAERRYKVDEQTSVSTAQQNMNESQRSQNESNLSNKNSTNYNSSDLAMSESKSKGVNMKVSATIPVPGVSVGIGGGYNETNSQTAHMKNENSSNQKNEQSRNSQQQRRNRNASKISGSNKNAAKSEFSKVSVGSTLIMPKGHIPFPVQMYDPNQVALMTIVLPFKNEFVCQNVQIDTNFIEVTEYFPDAKNDDKNESNDDEYGSGVVSWKPSTDPKLEERRKEKQETKRENKWEILRFDEPYEDHDSDDEELHEVGKFFEVDSYTLLKHWGLEQFAERMEDEGWKTPLDWIHLDDHIMRQNLGFRSGHIKMFNRKFDLWVKKYNAVRRTIKPKRKGKDGILIVAKKQIKVLEPNREYEFTKIVIREGGKLTTKPWGPSYPEGGVLWLTSFQEIVLEKDAMIDVSGCGYWGSRHTKAAGECPQDSFGGGKSSSKMGAGGGGYGTPGASVNKHSNENDSRKHGQVYGSPELFVLYDLKWLKRVKERIKKEIKQLPATIFVNKEQIIDKKAMSYEEKEKLRTALAQVRAWSLGSGGGCYRRTDNQRIITGGTGGGAIRLKCNKLIMYTGSKICSNGFHDRLGNGGNGDQLAGGGSGGSIYLIVKDSIQGINKNERDWTFCVEAKGGGYQIENGDHKYDNYNKDDIDSGLLSGHFSDLDTENDNKKTKTTNEKVTYKKYYSGGHGRIRIDYIEPFRLQFNLVCPKPYIEEGDIDVEDSVFETDKEIEIVEYAEEEEKQDLI